LLQLDALYYEQKFVKIKLAKEACEVGKSTRLGNPIGKQDQFAAALAVSVITSSAPDGFVKVEPIGYEARFIRKNSRKTS